MHEYDIERYLSVRSAYGADFGPDGTLSFRIDTTGTPQVWTLSEPGAWPTQRTFGDDRVTFASWSPERPELAFGMDEGGNERQQLYRLADDGTVENLTRTDAKHRWGGWSHDGDRLAFASNRREESAFDVYVQGREARGDDATLVHEGDGWLSLAGWSPGDDRLLVHEAHSSFDHDVHVLDIESGGLTRLTDDGDDEVRYSSLSWAPDGDGVYCCTDRDVDTLYLARLDATSGALETVVEGGGEREEARTPSGASPPDGKWNVDGVAIDDETGRLVYSRNVDGYTGLTVGELAGETTIETFPEPDLPAGVAGGVSFDDDAERFALTVTADTENTNVHVVDVETGAAERWTCASTAPVSTSTT